MKKYMLGFLSGLIAVVLFAFQSNQNSMHPAAARVEQFEGFYVYTDCTPLVPYDSIGVVELTFVGDTQYESVRNHLIKRSKKLYPQGEGLLMRFNKKGVDKCVVIQLKKQGR